MNISGFGHKNNVSFGAGKTVRVMHAEDYPTIRKHVERPLLQIVSEHGDTLELTQCPTCPMAEKALNEHSPFDLVISDGSISNPSDGLEIVEKARQTHLPEKVVMLSDNPELVEKVAKFGVEFLNKREMRNPEFLVEAFSRMLYGKK